MMDGLPRKEILEKVKRDWYIYMIADAAFWVPVQMINFRFIPLNFQPFYICCGTLGSAVIMSTIESRKVEMAPELAPTQE